MSCDRHRGRQPPAPAGLQAATRVCVYAHSQSQPPRSHSAPSQLENLHNHKRQIWYGRLRSRETDEVVAVEDAELQLPVSSCDTGLYKRLDESRRQIRLLELNPGASEEPISGSLLTVELPVLPPDFDERILLDELSKISNDIVFDVHSGHKIREDEVARWESIRDSLIWLQAYRTYAAFVELENAHGTATAKYVEGMRVTSSPNSPSLSEPALALQRISASLTTTLSRCSAYHSWTHDLNGLLAYCLSQRTRDLDTIIRFAEQMDQAVNKFIFEGSDGDSALTPVDVCGLQRFIANFDLVVRPRYAAVSWFWGHADQTDKMELDGQTLDFPVNAIRALRDLRDSVDSKKLWIDAVCINQNDKAERASQILLMGDVYSIACPTYVWLGNGDSTIRDAIRDLIILKDLSPYVKDSDPADITEPKVRAIYVPADSESLRDVSSFAFHSVDWYLWLESASSTKSVSEILDKVPPGHDLTRAQWQSVLTPRYSHNIYPLFDLPWFSRLWVFQEAVLSSHCTIVFGSDITFPLRDLEHGAGLISMFSMQPCEPNGLNLTLSIMRQHWKLGCGSRLLELVSERVEQECSDPRDYIFGLLGLTVWARRRQRWPHLIQPSYVKPVSDCMRDATRVMILEECDLSALLHWCQVEQSPTWAVHWHEHKHIRRRPAWHALATVSIPHSRDPGLFDLSLMEQNWDLNILLLKGLSISFVHSTVPLPTIDVDDLPGSGVAALEQVLRHVLDLSTRTGFKFSSRTITLTLMACSYKDPAPILESEGFHRLEYVVRNLWDELQGQGPKHCLSVPISDKYIFGQFLGVYRLGRLFTTPAGQLCVGPAGVQVGDKIVRLFGLPLPAVLRPEQSWYTFAGVAYIDREFPDVQDTSTLPPEIYEIR